MNSDRREHFIQQLKDFEAAESARYYALTAMTAIANQGVKAVGYDPARYDIVGISMSQHNGGSVIVDCRWKCDNDTDTIIVPEDVFFADDPEEAMRLKVLEDTRLRIEHHEKVATAARLKRYEVAGLSPEEIAEFERLQARLG